MPKDEFDEYTKSMEIVKMDNFLRDRMIQLVTEQMRESRRLNLNKDEKEKIEGEINFRKWVNHHVEKIRKAR